MMKDFAIESGSTGDVVSTDLDRTTKLIIARINLVGVQRVNFKVVHEGKGYRTFVRLRYSADESNKILMAEIRKNQALYARFKASKSFQELENEVRAIDQQKADEIRAMNGD
jgi:predicted site-specific integrase-resolvase